MTLRVITSNPAAVVRLVCFPYAGGSSAAFVPWRPQSPRWVALVGVEYPGHGSRMREGFADDVVALAAEAAHALSETASLPTVLFGHSMGALVAFEVAHRLAETTNASHMLVVSGCGSPGSDFGRPIADLPDEAFVEEVKRFGGIPDGVLDQEELRRLAIPMLRSDLKSYETYRRAPRHPLQAPILALGGDRDPSVSLGSIAGWRAETSGGFEYISMPGNHFFAFDGGAQVVATILDRVRSRINVSATHGGCW